MNTIDTIKHEIKKMRALNIGSVQLSIETVEALIAAYEAARHDLVTTDGLYAMDREIDNPDAFQIKHKSLAEAQRKADGA